jgi:hypothetical protein
MFCRCWNLSGIGRLVSGFFARITALNSSGVAGREWLAPLLPGKNMRIRFPSPCSSTPHSTSRFSGSDRPCRLRSIFEPCRGCENFVEDPHLSLFNVTVGCDCVTVMHPLIRHLVALRMGTQHRPSTTLWACILRRYFFISRPGPESRTRTKVAWVYLDLQCIAKRLFLHALRLSIPDTVGIT